MAIDELIQSNLKLVAGFLNGSLLHWTQAAMDARNSTVANPYTIDKFFEHLRTQVVLNWDTWSELAAQSTPAAVPTVTITRALADALPKWKASTFVYERLTKATFDPTDLEGFGGVGSIGKASVGVTKAGILDGMVEVSLKAKPGKVGVYRGLVLADVDGGTNFKPLTWVVVVAQ